jgi:hypothetical protein
MISAKEGDHAEGRKNDERGHMDCWRKCKRLEIEYLILKIEY